MSRDPFDEQLREWGQATMGRHSAPVSREAEADPGAHPISKARQFAPMTRARFAKQVAGRDGRDRRRLMADAAQAGMDAAKEDGQAPDQSEEARRLRYRMRLVPTWACDPVRATETRGGGGGGAAVDRGMPDHLEWIDRAVMSLYRQDTLRGLVVRMEYTQSGYQADKAIKVGAALGQTITVRQYREALRMGKEWVKARRAA